MAGLGKKTMRVGLALYGKATHTSAMTDLRPKVQNIAALARRLKADYSHLHAVLKGAQTAGPMFAIAIERETEGVIKRGDLRPDLWPDHGSTPAEPAA